MRGQRPECEIAEPRKTDRELEIIFDTIHRCVPPINVLARSRFLWRAQGCGIFLENLVSIADGGGLSRHAAAER
jgi:hypothetical protein